MRACWLAVWRQVVIGLLLVIALSGLAQAEVFTAIANGTLDEVLAQGIDVNQRVSEAGITPLIYAIVTASEPAVLQKLLDAGAQVDMECAEGQTPLMYAAHLSHRPEYIDILITAKASLTRQNALGLTPFLTAVAYNEQTEVIKAFVRNGQNIDAVSTIRSGGATFAQLTPLMIAAWMNPNPQIVAVLLELGANPYARDKWGNTAIAYAEMNDKLTDTKEFSLLAEQLGTSSEQFKFQRLAAEVFSTTVTNGEIRVSGNITRCFEDNRFSHVALSWVSYDRSGQPIRYEYGHLPLNEDVIPFELSFGGFDMFAELTPDRSELKVAATNIKNHRLKPNLSLTLTTVIALNSRRLASNLVLAGEIVNTSTYIDDYYDEDFLVKFADSNIVAAQTRDQKTVVYPGDRHSYALTFAIPRDINPVNQPFTIYYRRNNQLV